MGLLDDAPVNHKGNPRGLPERASSIGCAGVFREIGLLQQGREVKRVKSGCVGRGTAVFACGKFVG